MPQTTEPSEQVIGHEIGHQFDDGGSKFDSTGALAKKLVD